MSDPVLNNEGKQATLTRNEATLPLIIGTFSKLAGDNKGKKFPYPEVDEKSWETAVNFIGTPFLVNLVQKKLRTVGGQLYIASWDEEKRDDLEERKAELADKINAMTEQDDFMTNFTKYSKEVEAIGEQIGAINVSLKKIQADIDAKTAKRNATKAKNAADLAAKNVASQAAKTGQTHQHQHA
jgi:hypothetical protein